VILTSKEQESVSVYKILLFSIPVASILLCLRILTKLKGRLPCPVDILYISTLGKTLEVVITECVTKLVDQFGLLHINYFGA
jgi:hypothetical protein